MLEKALKTWYRSASASWKVSLAAAAVGLPQCLSAKGPSFSRLCCPLQLEGLVFFLPDIQNPVSRITALRHYVITSLRHVLSLLGGFW